MKKITRNHGNENYIYESFVGELQEIYAPCKNLRDY